MQKVVNNIDEMMSFGEKLGFLLLGGVFIELVGDVGAGKTTFVKGLAIGMGVKDDVQSPSFTINRVYSARDELLLSHYDFYRLNDVGIMADELRESIDDINTVTVIEWGGIVENSLPQDRIVINITTLTEESRKLEISAGGEKSRMILEKIK